MFSPVFAPSAILARTDDLVASPYDSGNRHERRKGSRKDRRIRKTMKLWVREIYTQAERADITKRREQRKRQKAAKKAKFRNRWRKP